MRKKIDRLTIKGFKSIRDLSNFSLGDINVVVGANGAGKSNFVQMFRMVREMVRKDFQKFIATHGGAAAFLHNGLKATKSIEAEFNLGGESYGNLTRKKLAASTATFWNGTFRKIGRLWFYDYRRTKKAS